jgi:hypothetical protein
MQHNASVQECFLSGPAWPLYGTKGFVSSQGMYSQETTHANNKLQQAMLFQQTMYRAGQLFLS